jgi:RNA polymerase sigma-70 factor (ECF subfamily)
VHTDADTAEQTDWRQILALYDQLLALNPTPIVALNRAIALAEVHGPAVALEIVDHLDLDGYSLYHATRADLLARCERREEALAAYRSAMQRASNEVEARFIEGRATALEGR